MSRKGPKGYCCEMDCGPYNKYRKRQGKQQTQRERVKAKKEINKYLYERTGTNAKDSGGD